MPFGSAMYKCGCSLANKNSKPPVTMMAKLVKETNKQVYYEIYRVSQKKIGFRNEA